MKTHMTIIASVLFSASLYGGLAQTQSENQKTLLHGDALLEVLKSVYAKQIAEGVPYKKAILDCLLGFIKGNVTHPLVKVTYKRVPYSRANFLRGNIEAVLGDGYNNLHSFYANRLARGIFLVQMRPTGLQIKMAVEAQDLIKLEEYKLLLQQQGVRDLCNYIDSISLSMGWGKYEQAVALSVFFQYLKELDAERLKNSKDVEGVDKIDFEQWRLWENVEDFKKEAANKGILLTEISIKDRVVIFEDSEGTRIAIYIPNND